jgi:hypothetical protein
MPSSSASPAAVLRRCRWQPMITPMHYRYNSRLVQSPRGWLLGGYLAARSMPSVALTAWRRHDWKCPAWHALHVDALLRSAVLPRWYRDSPRALGRETPGALARLAVLGVGGAAAHLVLGAVVVRRGRARAEAARVGVAGALGHCVWLCGGGGGRGVEMESWRAGGLEELGEWSGELGS